VILEKNRDLILGSYLGCPFLTIKIKDLEDHFLVILPISGF
jgi:hypothetical protein